MIKRISPPLSTLPAWQDRSCQSALAIDEDIKEIISAVPIQQFPFNTAVLPFG